MPVGCVPSTSVAVSPACMPPCHAHPPATHTTPCHACPLPMYTPTLCHAHPLHYAYHLCHACPHPLPHTPLFAMHIPLCHTCPPVNRITDRCKNITFLQFRLRVVKINFILACSKSELFLTACLQCSKGNTKASIQFKTWSIKASSNRQPL